MPAWPITTAQAAARHLSRCQEAAAFSVPWLGTVPANSGGSGALLHAEVPTWAMSAQWVPLSTAGLGRPQPSSGPPFCFLLSSPVMFRHAEIFTLIQHLGALALLLNMKRPQVISSGTMVPTCC